MASAESLDEYYRIPPDLRDMNYDKFFEEGMEDISSASEYTSHNTKRLGVKEMKLLLQNLKPVQLALQGKNFEPEG